MNAQTIDPKAATLGLRERKKRQTRDNISTVATRLFLERGFDAVTIAEIAAAADVAKMTVTNYFPRKEDLILDLHEEFVAKLPRSVRGRQPGESALAALRRDYLTDAAELNPIVGFAIPEFARVVTGSPALVARLREFHEDREKALAETLAEETGVAPDDLTAQVAAALLAGVHRLLFEETVRRACTGATKEELGAVMTPRIAAAFDLLEPALGHYAVRAD
ncbi:TetR family transcriptional regulator [Nocardia sp. NPDC050406]|uniref:TetR family transcriptional regulator n=1 Tax=Nocardia sp. NPDC050406 TaxID=3364318 RepID=UPI003789787C